MAYGALGISVGVGSLIGADWGSALTSKIVYPRRFQMSADLKGTAKGTAIGAGLGLGFFLATVLLVKRLKSKESKLG